MINIFRSLTLLAFTFLVIFTSCKKDEAALPNSPTNPDVYSFTYTFNGASQSIVEANTNVYISTDANFNLRLLITGLTSNADNLTLACPNAIGSYPISSNATTAITNINRATRTVCTSGTITITAYDKVNKKVSGTFNGSGTGISITNGVFTNLTIR